MKTRTYNFHSLKGAINPKSRVINRQIIDGQLQCYSVEILIILLLHCLRFCFAPSLGIYSIHRINREHDCVRLVTILLPFSSVLVSFCLKNIVVPIQTLLELEHENSNTIKSIRFNYNLSIGFERTKQYVVSSKNSLDRLSC